MLEEVKEDTGGPHTQVSTGNEERELERIGLDSVRRNPSKDRSQERTCCSGVTEIEISGENKVQRSF